MPQPERGNRRDVPLRTGSEGTGGSGAGNEQ